MTARMHQAMTARMQQEMTAHEHREMPAHMEDEITAHMHQLRALLLQVYHQYLLQSLSFSLIENTYKRVIF